MAGMDEISFSAAVLNAMGIDVTPYTLAALMSVQQGEGQWTATGSWNAASDYNPFNISGGQSVLNQYHANTGVSLVNTQPPGNGPPVDEFSNWQSGVKATADFLAHADPGVTSALQQVANNPTTTTIQDFFTQLQNSGSFGTSAGSRIQFFNNNLKQAQTSSAALASYTPPGGSIQNNPTPGTPATSPAGGSSGSTPPVSVTPGTTTLQKGTGTPGLTAEHLTQAQVKQYIKQHWPSYAWLLNDPQVDKVLTEAADNAWDATQVQAAIAQTDWWKNTSTSMQQWQMLEHTQPGQARREVENEIDTITAAAHNAGIKISTAQAEHLAQSAVEFGWTSQQIQDNIGAFTNAQAGGEAIVNPQYLQYQNSAPDQLKFTKNANGSVKSTGGTWADQQYNMISQYLKSQGITNVTGKQIEQLATQSMMDGSGTQGWTTQQMEQAVGKLRNTGVTNSQYTTFQTDDPAQLKFTTNAKGQIRATGGTWADQQYNMVHSYLISQGITGLSTKQIEQLATESMKNGTGEGGFSEQQLAQAVGKLNGTGAANPTYSQYQTNDPAQLKFTLNSQGQVDQHGATWADQQYNMISQYLKSQGITGVSDAQIKQLATESMKNGSGTGGYSQQQLATAINSMRQSGANFGAINPAYSEAQTSNPASLKFTLNKNGTVDETGATLADQQYGRIAQYLKTIGVSGIPEDEIKSLAMQSLQEGSGTNGWNDQQLQQAVHNIVNSGQGNQQLSSQYLQTVAANPGAVEFENKKAPWEGTNEAAQYAAAVRNVAINAGVSFSDQEIEQLATEGMKQNWMGSAAGQTQMANAIGQLAKTKGVLVDPTVAAQELANPKMFEFTQGGNGPSTLDKNLQTFKQALALAQVGGLSLKQMENYVKQGTSEGMFDPGNTAALTDYIGKIAKDHGVTVDSKVLQQQLSNPKVLDITKGANPWLGVSQGDQALENVRFVASGLGMNVNDPKVEAELTKIVQEGLPKGWFDASNPAATQQLQQALSMFANANGIHPENQQYLTDLLTQANEYAPPTANEANPQYGSTIMDAALSSILNEAQSQGIKLTQSQMVAIAEKGFVNGWINAQTGAISGQQLAQYIGQLAGKQGLQPYSASYLTGKAQNPQEYKFTKTGDTTLADQTRLEVEVTASQQGVNLSLSQAEEIATQAMQFGWNTQQIQQAIAKDVTYQQKPTPTTVQQPAAGHTGITVPPGQTGSTTTTSATSATSTNAQALIDQIQQTAATYLQSLPTAVAQQWAQNIAGGTQTTEQLQAYLQQQAEQKWPGMADLLKQGLTPQQITASLTSQTANLLGIDPTQVNYINDPQYAKMLTGGYNVTSDGGMQPNNSMMTLQQAESYIKTLPQYQYTADAKNNAANVETAILQAFGRVG